MLSNLVHEDRSKQLIGHLAKAFSLGIMIDFFLKLLKAELPITKLSNSVHEDRSKYLIGHLAKAFSPIVKFLTFLGIMIDFILEPLKAESPITMLSNSVYEVRSKQLIWHLAKAFSPIVKFLTFLGTIKYSIPDPLKAPVPILKVFNSSIEGIVIDSRFLHNSKANDFILKAVTPPSIITFFNFWDLQHAWYPIPLTLNVLLSVVIVLGIYKFSLSSIGYKIAFPFSSNVYLNLVLVLFFAQPSLVPNEVIVTSLFLFINSKPFKSSYNECIL